MRKWMVMITAVVMMSAPVAGYAHSGGTDQNGCHNDSSTGTRHCHNTGSEEGGECGTGCVVTLAVLGLAGLAGLVYLAASAQPTGAGPQSPALPSEEHGDDDNWGIKVDVGLENESVMGAVQWLW